MLPKPMPQPLWWDRFFACIFRFSDDPNACWIWTGPFDGSGYGMFSWDRQSRTGGRTAAQRAHRFLFEHLNGSPIANGLVVMHACDTPQCVNPNHLSLGTIDENMADRNNKGRQARGSRNPRAILTEDDVLKIRASTDHPETIAEQFGVSSPLIYNIRSRRIWRHI